MLSPAVSAVLIAAGTLILLFVAALVYVKLRYAPIISRIFLHPPVFQPQRNPPLEGGEDVRFATADGLSLAGTYLKARAPERAGVIVFCPEYLGDRGSAGPYADFLRDLGFDLFAFDFRNHGDSETEAKYEPLQWVADREIRDLEAALSYLRGREDADPAGVALFGISRGGTTSICTAAREPRIWAIATDGAFGTSTTMIAYIGRWAEIYVANDWLWKMLPSKLFAFAGWAGRMTSQRKLGWRFMNVERGAANLGPRPLFMIHGANDNYISKDIARTLFDQAREPKELWIVPKAKHNRCLDVNPAAYRERVGTFFRRYAPRRTSTSAIAPPDDQEVAMSREDRI